MKAMLGTGFNETSRTISKVRRRDPTRSDPSSLAPDRGIGLLLVLLLSAGLVSGLALLVGLFA